MPILTAFCIYLIFLVLAALAAYFLGYRTPSSTVVIALVLMGVHDLLMKLNVLPRHDAWPWLAFLGSLVLGWGIAYYFLQRNKVSGTIIPDLT